MTPIEHGIIAPAGQAPDVEAAGADYTELTVVGSLLEEGEDGTWRPTALPRPLAPAPSFAILLPGTMRVSDPRVPIEETATYLRSAFAAIAPHARPGATVVLGSGAARRIPEDVDRAAAEERFALSVRTARDLAAEHDLEVLLEPLHRGETNLVTTIAEAVAFLDAHDLAGVRVVADLFHVMLEEEPFAVVREHAGRVGHAHVADTDRRPPGQGDWPLAAFLTALRDGGYAGHVSIECFTWQDVPTEGRDALAVLREADPAAAV